MTVPGLVRVSSSSCGIPEIIADGVTGTMVPAGDAAALADALITTLSDEVQARRAGRAGRARVERLYTWDAVVDRMALAILENFQGEVPDVLRAYGAPERVSH